MDLSLLFEILTRSFLPCKWENNNFEAKLWHIAMHFCKDDAVWKAKSNGRKDHVYSQRNQPNSWLFLSLWCPGEWPRNPSDRSRTKVTIGCSWNGENRHWIFIQYTFISQTRANQADYGACLKLTRTLRFFNKYFIIKLTWWCVGGRLTCRTIIVSIKFTT